jgi:hypothetical protein
VPKTPRLGPKVYTAGIEGAERDRAAEFRATPTAVVFSLEKSRLPV